MVSWGSAYEYPQCIFLHNELQDFMGQFDACPTGDQEVEGLIPVGSGNMFSWIDLEIFFCSSRKHTYTILTPLNPTFI